MFWKRSSDPKAKLVDRLGEYELPSFPAAAVSTLGLLRQDAPMAEVAESIMTDPGLSVRILRTVNSAAFGLRQKASNLQYAVNLLGRSRVESLVLVAAVGEALPAPDDFDLRGFWRTAAHRACLARKIAASVSPATELECFTAGLLQDMAVPVLVTSLPGYPGLYSDAIGGDQPGLPEYERKILGYDHAEIGALMAETWDLPESLIAAIAGHHGTGDCAPDAVEAVAQVRHGEPSNELEAFRGHCRAHPRLGVLDLDAVIDGASGETAELADSMIPRAAPAT